MRWKLTVMLSMLVLAGTGGAVAQDNLFEEAGHALGHSRWVLIADCEVTEQKDMEFTVASESKNKWTTGTTTTTTTYWSRCLFPEGTAKSAVSAREIVVQVAMTNGSTKPHPLKPKELSKFQRLNK
jgi:hypothetical protein